VQISDPGYGYTGEVARAAVLVDGPERRGRPVRDDLVLELARHLPVDVYGIGAGELHADIARRRACVHTNPSTVLGLSLLEVMRLGLPVVPLASTETDRAVVAGVGVRAVDAVAMIAATRHLLTDPAAARELGRYARRAALVRDGLEHFLADWREVLVRDAA
jgi:glycosyltransferase involved in cell wall biosynthesis